MEKRKVAFFHSGRKASFQEHFEHFLRGLHDLVPASDVEVIERFASDDPARRSVPDQAVEMSNHAGIEVLVAAGGPPSSKATMEATRGKSVPVVFMSTANPVGLGLVKTLEKPGTNMTGIAGLTSELDVSRLELLAEALPNRGTAKIGVLNNGNRPMLEEQYQALATAAPGMNVLLVRQDAVNIGEIKNAFAHFREASVDGVLVTADSLFNDLRKDVVALAQGLRAIYQWREFVEVGGFMSFGPNVMEAYTLVGNYAGRILKGEKPQNMPVASPSRFELVINLTNAEQNGFHIPASLLSRAELVRHALTP
jgi:putative tryptophan/tyrosine transport system substrate-binding protein